MFEDMLKQHVVPLMFLSFDVLFKSKTEQSGVGVGSLDIPVGFAFWLWHSWSGPAV